MPEVRRRLGDAGYRADLVDGAIERLVALGYLDDEAFARAWVESRDRAHPRGERALRDELRRKGVAAEDVEAALAAREATAAGTDEDDAALEPGSGERAGSAASDADAAARLLARRGGPLLREQDPRRRRAKAYALLARNGFDPDVCRESVATWLRDGRAGPRRVGVLAGRRRRTVGRRLTLPAPGRTLCATRRACATGRSAPTIRRAHADPAPASEAP